MIFDTICSAFSDSVFYMIYVIYKRSPNYRECQTITHGTVEQTKQYRIRGHKYKSHANEENAFPMSFGESRFQYSPSRYPKFDFVIFWVFGVKQKPAHVDSEYRTVSYRERHRNMAEGNAISLTKTRISRFAVWLKGRGVGFRLIEIREKIKRTEQRRIKTHKGEGNRYRFRLNIQVPLRE